MLCRSPDLLANSALLQGEPMARIDLDIDDWSAVAPSTGRLIWLIPPRLLSDSGLEILGKCKR